VVYLPEVAMKDTGWSYVFSHQEQQYTSYEYTEQRNLRQNLQSSQQPPKKDPIAQFSTIIDSEDPRFEKQKA